MAGNKSDWTSGSYLTPAFAQGFFGYNTVTGHDHYGLDASDSGKKLQISQTFHDATTDGTVVFRVEPPYSSANVDTTGNYHIIGNQVTLSWPAILGDNTATNEGLRIAPADGAWPSGILPADSKILPVFGLKSGSSGDMYPCAISIATDATASWRVYILDDGTMNASEFGHDADPYQKGLFGGSVTYTKF